PAERGDQFRASAQAGDGDGRVGGAAADHRQEGAGLRLGLRRGKALDPEHLVEHGHAGAQDARRHGADHARPGSSTQARMMWWAMATGGGVMMPPGCRRSNMLATSSRLNQRASSSSLWSTVTSVDSASTWQPIISDMGNGHGCEAK